MKIAFHINTLSKGGAERAVINLAEYFWKEGNDVTIITSKRCKSEYTVSEGVKRINLSEEYDGSFFFRFVTLSRLLRKICLREKYDVIIPFISGSILRAYIAAISTNTSVVGSVRNDPNYEYAGTFGKIMSKYIMPKLDGCVFQTNDAKEWFPTTLRDKSVVIFNSIKPVFYNVIRHPKKYSVVTIGRLAPQKNQALLINSFVEVHKQEPKATLEIYGSGVLHESLKKLIIERDAVEYIFLRGETSKVRDVLSTADIFVLPSNFEGMPNALMEAMAVGVPCISTDCPCGGPRNLLDDGEIGILVQPNNINELSSAITKLLHDENQRLVFSKKSIEKSLMLTEDKIGQSWIKYINGIVNGQKENKRWFNIIL